MEAAPVGTRRDEPPDEGGGAPGVDAEGGRPPAHLHARALELDIGVHAHRQPRGAAERVGDAQRAVGFALRFEIERDARGDRGFQLGVALAGSGEADRRGRLGG